MGLSNLPKLWDILISVGERSTEVEALAKVGVDEVEVRMSA